MCACGYPLLSWPWSRCSSCVLPLDVNRSGSKLGWQYSANSSPTIMQVNRKAKLHEPQKLRCSIITISMDERFGVCVNISISLGANSSFFIKFEVSDIHHSWTMVKQLYTVCVHLADRCCICIYYVLLTNTTFGWFICISIQCQYIMLQRPARVKILNANWLLVLIYFIEM